MLYDIPQLTSGLLVSISGTVLSLLMGLFPPFRNWLENRVGDWKYLFMAGVLFVVAAGYTVLYCKLNWGCVADQLPLMCGVWVAAMLQNQAAYKAVVKPIQLKEERAAEIARLKWGR